MTIGRSSAFAAVHLPEEGYDRQQLTLLLLNAELRLQSIGISPKEAIQSVQVHVMY
jgi:hypothetical protein